MNRYDAILQLKKLRYDYETGAAAQIGDRVYEAAKLAAVLLEKMSDDDSWISVSRLLPETCEEVLTVDEDRNCRVLYYEGGKWYDNIDDCRQVGITHWKPIPKLPERKPKAMAVLPEIPERCEECPLYNSRIGFCDLLKDWVEVLPEMRDGKCPLIELPDKHNSTAETEMEAKEIFA